MSDSLPEYVVHELLELPEDERSAGLNQRLDRGYGSCILEQPRIAKIVEGNMNYFDGDRYRLNEWVIMPNHVHVLIDKPQAPLRKIMHGWRSYTSNRIQEVLPDHETPDEGRLWQPGFYDRSIRDRAHYWNCCRYTWLNAVKAGLSDTPWDWEWSSACRSVQAEDGDRLKRWFRDYRRKPSDPKSL